MLFVGVSVSVVLKLRTEIESDWISVEKPSGVLEVLEAAGGQAESGARSSTVASGRGPQPKATPDGCALRRQ